MFGDPAKTVDGLEMPFQINHLAPFLLPRLLMDSLLTSGASVIQTSSVGARMASRIDTEDLNLDRHLGPICVYGIAKLENILFTGELHRRYQVYDEKKKPTRTNKQADADLARRLWERSEDLRG
ncbi:hypothetical protein [Streptomyces sp. NPDC093990]|uniref:hypothetical protein n=1 Tax=Streptomyces sp. NPDC093990 TaxID=3155306 RepID=UPI003415E2C2